jgi:hypothetical protein
MPAPFEILTAVTMRIIVFWNIIPYNILSGHSTIVSSSASVLGKRPFKRPNTLYTIFLTPLISLRAPITFLSLPTLVPFLSTHALLSHPDDVGSRFLRNVGYDLPDYKALRKNFPPQL